MQTSYFKTALLSAAILFSSLSFTSCDNNRAEDDKVYNEYRDYVVSVRDTSDRYWDREWNEIEREYEELKNKASAKMDGWDDKRKEEFNELERDWNSFKERYNEQRTVRDSERRINEIRSQVLANPDVQSIQQLQGPEILPAYQRFESSVKSNMANYSTQDWNEVNSIYNALKARRQEVMNQIPKDDKMKIQNIELGYETTMTTNKPFSPSEN